MDEIKNLQNKYSSITITQLEEIMNKRGKKINQVIHEQDQQLKENEEKLEKLMSELVMIKEDIDIEQQVLEQKNKELSKHNEHFAELKAEYNKFVEENQNLQIKRNLFKNTKPNQQDQLLLETGRKKLRMYKEWTGVHWDYSSLKENIVGYVSNKSDYIHYFNFAKDEKDSEELSSLLWHEIYLSVENKLNENKKSSNTNE
ncbi:putative autophagy-related protein 11 [Vespula maculifrons]|nr:putative autophagy-related protein 11 [Vespula vulgaris]